MTNIVKACIKDGALYLLTKPSAGHSTIGSPSLLELLHADWPL